jgi:hypothetical protein
MIEAVAHAVDELTDAIRTSGPIRRSGFEESRVFGDRGIGLTTHRTRGRRGQPRVAVEPPGREQRRTEVSHERLAGRDDPAETECRVSIVHGKKIPVGTHHAHR